MDEHATISKYLPLAAVGLVGFVLVRKGAGVVLVLALVLLMVKFRNQVAAAVAQLPGIGPALTT